MVTSKLIKSSLPLGNDMTHDFGRFSSEISARGEIPNALEETPTLNKMVRKTKVIPHEKDFVET